MKRLFIRDVVGLFYHTKKCLITLALSALVSFFVVLSSALFPPAGSVATFLNNTATFLFLVLLFAIPVILVIGTVQTHRYYYHSFLGDERLFTLSLPITREQLLLSRLLANSVWSLLLSLLGILAIFVGMLLPFELLLEGNISLLSNLLRSVSKLFSPLSLLELLVLFLAETVLADTAVTVGTMLFPRRRALGILLFLLAFCGGALLARFSVLLAVSAFLEDLAILGGVLSLLFSLLSGAIGVLLTLRFYARKNILL